VLIQVIFFRGDTHADLPLARELMLEYRTKGKAAIRLAPVFMGDVEECERVVLLPLVHPTHAARITAAYEAAGIPVERYGEQAPAETPPKVVVEKKTEPAPLMPAIEVRRLSNRQLTELARVRGITFPTDEPDRAEMIAAITAAKEPPS
jgi:hypothetical protein